MSRLRYSGVVGAIASGGLTNSATSHTFGTALLYSNGVTLPTLTGTDYFMLSILDSSGSLSEVVRVTAYNSGTKVATLVRGQEGTTGVVHSAGDRVTTAAYATDFFGRNVDDPNDPMWATPLTYDIEFEDDSASTLPSGYSWINQGSGTYTQLGGAGVLTHPGIASGDDVKMAVRSVPSESAWVATAKVAVGGADDVGFAAGLVLRNSSSGKILLIGPRHTSVVSGTGTATFAGFYFTGSTAFGSSAFTTVATPGHYRYVRIQKVSATSWSFFGSQDCVTWHTMITAHDVSAQFTPDQIGFGVYQVGNLTPMALGIHWLRVR